MPPEEQATLDRACWRVTEAAPGSGWTAGQAFTVEGAQGGTISLVGFERPVTFEGRVLRADGRIAFAIVPTAVQLDAARTLAPDAGALVAVMSREAWAERDAVHVWGERVSTEEVVDGTAHSLGQPVTLHRAASGLHWRGWGRDAGAITWSDVALGAGERALLGHHGYAVAIDEELLLIGREGEDEIVRHRVPLGAPPRALIADAYYDAVAQLDDAIVGVDRASGATRALPAGEGRLLPGGRDSAPVFFDGTSFVPLDRSGEGLAFAESMRFAPSAEHLAALGTPLAVMHGVVLGERGLLLAGGEGSEVAGPRFASIADIFGDGRLALIGGDDITYVVERADGSRVLYEAPYTDFCE